MPTGKRGKNNQGSRGGTGTPSSKGKGMRLARYILFILVFTIYNGSAWAMYKCIDKAGKTSFVDTPVSSSCSPMNLGHEVKLRVTDKTTFRSGIIRQTTGNKAGKYDHFINFYGVRYNVDPHLIRAVIKTESAFNPRAVSKKGAQGLMQLMPATARELRVIDSFDPKQNIEGGTRYLRSLLTTFKDDKQLALAAYNAGPTAVKRERGIPRYPETVKYVKRVLQYYREYKSG